MKISIVIAFYNEEENVDFVLGEVRRKYAEAEIIAIDDGSTDRTREKISAVKGVSLLASDRNQGKGVALYDGFMKATGDICVMMDGDGQNDPEDIGPLIEALRTYDCAWGYRGHRKASTHRRIVSFVGNTARKMILGEDGVRDAGCALRAFHKRHVDNLVRFEGLHRFMAIFFKEAGLVVKEIPVTDRPRRKGSSKYSTLDRALRGIRDLTRVRSILKSRKDTEMPETLQWIKNFND